MSQTSRNQPFAAAMFFDRYNENHDPDTGEFASGSGGGSGGSVAPIGSGSVAKSKEPVGYEFVSPSVADHMDFDQAVEAVSSDQHRALRDASLYINGALGIHATEHDIIGAWADGAENSVMDVVEKADWDKLVLSGSMKGYLADQKSVLIFQQSAAGSQAIASFEAKGDLATIHKHLLEDGVTFHSLVPSKGGATVYVAMVDPKTIDETIAAVEKGAERYEAEVTIHHGHGEFLGVESSGNDREQRDNSREAYAKNIRESKVAGSAQLWKRVRDRWSTEHQGLTFSPGIVASNDDEKIAATKADWIASSPIKSIDDVIAAAKPAQEKLGTVASAAAEKLHAEFKDPGPKTKSQKGIDRIKVKAAKRGDNFATVTDVARGTFIVEHPDQVEPIVEELAKHFEVTLENWRQTTLGYLDRTALIHFPNGLIGEIQFMDPAMSNAKSDKGGNGHGMYVEWRGLDLDKPDQAKRADELVAQMQKLYGDVVANYSDEWKAALGRAGT